MKKLLFIIPFIFLFSCKDKEEKKPVPTYTDETPARYKYLHQESYQESRFDSLMLTLEQMPTNCKAYTPTVYKYEDFDTLPWVTWNTELEFLKPSININYIEKCEVNIAFESKDSVLMVREVVASRGTSSVKSTDFFPYNDAIDGTNWNRLTGNLGYYFRFEYNNKEYFITDKQRLNKFIGYIDDVPELAFFTYYARKSHFVSYKKVIDGYELIENICIDRYYYDIRKHLNTCGELSIIDTVAEGQCDGTVF
jgi:hypothetical protein